MTVNDTTKHVSDLLEGQATLDTPEKGLYFGIIRDAVADLGFPDIAMDSNDYPPEMYFQCEVFKVHAGICDLDPEYVINILDKYGLMRDGRRVHETSKFIAA